MLKNYFTIALRSLTKYKGYSTINLLGLTVGITTCILIYLYIQHELSYDQFHAQADRIYRADNTYLAEGMTTYPTVASAMAVGAQASIPSVEDVVRISRFGGGFNNAAIVRIEDNFYREQQVYTADASFFSLFSFTLLEGDAASAMADPFTSVLTEETALKYFGRTDVVGESFRFANDDEHEYRVTGVVANPPSNSHFTFSLLISTESIASLNPDVDLATTWNNDGYYAMVNYMNLATARSARRAKVGLRKVLGASVSQITALLSKDFLKIVLIAGIIAVPISFWLARQWLTDFAYQTPITAMPFVLAVVGAVLTAVITVGSRAVRAARANPAESLRSE